MRNFWLISIAIFASSCAAVIAPPQASTMPAEFRILAASQPAPEELFCVDRAGAEQTHKAFIDAKKVAAVATEDAKEARAQDHKDALLVRWGLPSVSILGFIIGGALGIAAAHH